MLGGGFHRDVCLLLRVLGDLQILFGKRALIVQDLGAVELRLGELLIGHRLAVIRECRRNVGALHAHQELALADGISQPRADLHDAAGGDRDDRHIARNVRAHHAGDVQLRRSVAQGGRGQRELLGMIHRHKSGSALLYPPPPGAAVPRHGPQSPSIVRWQPASSTAQHAATPASMRRVRFIG